MRHKRSSCDRPDPAGDRWMSWTGNVEDLSHLGALRDKFTARRLDVGHD